MIVVDASVAVKTYMTEVGTETATALLTGSSRLWAPELIRLEVCGALWRRVRKGELLEAEAELRCKHWLKELEQQTIGLIPDRELVPSALEFAKQLKHPVADCMYLAVAHRFDAAVVTADRKFHDRAKPVYDKISLLAGCENN